MAGEIVVSVVSHGHGRLVSELLENIERYCDHDRLQVVVTVNIPEPQKIRQDNYSFEVSTVTNVRPKGYGANHNAAFTRRSGKAFCVINPDITFQSDPFGELYDHLQRLKAGVVAPLVINSSGDIEDSARELITPFRIAKRICRRHGRLEYDVTSKPISPDWLAGMFLMFSSRVYAKADGFDERYFMYCEDADICVRLRALGLQPWLIPTLQVTHNARRNSHRHPSHLWWHIKSLARFCSSHRETIGAATQRTA